MKDVLIGMGTGPTGGANVYAPMRQYGFSREALMFHQQKKELQLRGNIRLPDPIPRARGGSSSISSLAKE